MSEPDWKLPNAPIVEAVVDLDCVMPPGQDITALEAPARDAYGDRYPNVRPVYVGEALIEHHAGAAPEVSTKHGIQGYQFWQKDERQLVQVRAQGFSFNRLAPYTSLDDYLPEVERTWRQFVGIASPFEVQRVRLRYINRILIPTVDGRVELDDYLRGGPRLPDEKRLQLTAFVNQQIAVERETSNQVNIILASQPPEGDRCTVILDIAAMREERTPPTTWDSLLAQVQSLRGLKNRVFRDSLTDKCMELFR
jgi:uncharacterized protein (TIGR04255 family)